MVRYQITQGPITIAYGYDGAMVGYFLSVTDDRLGYQEGDSSQVNDICEKVSMDGGGGYFNLNTYVIGGFGYKVSKATIFTFMKRYGIDPTTIDTTL
ncbi:hypothetical protein BGZ76_006626 [Entomortierella beljakovae]|nr:hypothetical protein BGZ76_006626 [Entomortierella beljakovae]